MNHRMAVWAHGAEVVDGIDGIVLADLRHGCKVMNMNEPRCGLTIARCKVHLTDLADEPIVRNACVASGAASFISGGGMHVRRTFLMQ